RFHLLRHLRPLLRRPAAPRRQDARRRRRAARRAVGPARDDPLAGVAPDGHAGRRRRGRHQRRRDGHAVDVPRRAHVRPPARLPLGAGRAVVQGAADEPSGPAVGRLQRPLQQARRHVLCLLGRRLSRCPAQSAHRVAAPLAPLPARPHPAPGRRLRKAPGRPAGHLPLVPRPGRAGPDARARPQAARRRH
ncbi:hypothetical protein LTR39_005847, partial [Cryomyces antarcticus]